MFESKCQPLIIDNKKYVLDTVHGGELKEVLQDFSSSGRENPLAFNKRLTEYLSKVYRNFNLPDNNDIMSNGRKPSDYRRTPSKLNWCSNYLEFLHLKDKTKHISYIESCHCSLCPSCNFFRSRNNLKNMILILEDFFSVPSNCNFPFVFLTLTVPDCAGSDLRNVIKSMNQAFNKFLGYKEIKDSVVGCSRSFEITINNDEDSESYGLFHPHFHVLLIMKKDYFLFHRCADDDIYMNKLQWLLLWQRALGLHKFRPTVSNQHSSKGWRKARNDCFEKWLHWFGAFFTSGEPLKGHLLPSAPPDLVTNIDIKRVNRWSTSSPEANARKCLRFLTEAVKYTFKPDNILSGNLFVDTPRVYWLDGAMYHLRRWNLSGVLRVIFKKLQAAGQVIEDDDNTDLVQIAGVDIDDIDYITAWWFSSAFGEYLSGKIKTLAQKNKARRALGLPELSEDLFKNVSQR